MMFFPFCLQGKIINLEVKENVHISKSHFIILNTFSNFRKIATNEIYILNTVLYLFTTNYAVFSIKKISIMPHNTQYDSIQCHRFFFTVEVGEK